MKTKRGAAQKVKNLAARGLVDLEWERVRGGTKLPGKRMPPTVILKRGLNSTT